MLAIQLRVTILIAVILYFTIIVKMINNKTLNLKYTLLWILPGIIMLVVMLFPEIAGKVANLLGISLAINAVLFIGGFFVLVIILSLTAIVSKQTTRIRDLTQKLAILEKDLRDLKENK